MRFRRIITFMFFVSVSLSYTMESPPKENVELTPKSKAILEDPDSSPAQTAIALEGRARFVDKKRRKVARSILGEIENIQELRIPEGYSPEKAQRIQDGVEKLRLGLESEVLIRSPRGTLPFHTALERVPQKKVDALIRGGITDLASPQRSPYARLAEDLETRYALRHILYGTQKGGGHLYPPEGIPSRGGLDPTQNTDNEVIYAWPTSTDETKTMYPPDMDIEKWFGALKRIIADPFVVRPLKKGQGAYMIGADGEAPFFVEVVRNKKMIEGKSVYKVSSAYPLFSYTKWMPEAINHVASLKNLVTGDEQSLDFTPDELKNLAYSAIHEYAPHFEHDNPLRYRFRSLAGEDMAVVDIGLKLSPYSFPLRGVYVEIPSREIGLPPF